MIKINKIQETKCQLIGPDGYDVGEIDNCLSLNDVLIQIKSERVRGYSIDWNGRRINIDHHGNLQEWPKGFFDESIDQLLDLHFCTTPKKE